MTIAYKFPEAFKRGAEAARAHYERFYRGEIGELDFPPHPYPSPEETNQRETEWHAYNAGWYAGLPEDDEDEQRRCKNP